MSKRKSTQPPSTVSNNACPCGSGKRYAACCQLLHDGAAAGSAEALMRSRYSAFVLDLPEYLQRSWHRSARTAERDGAAGEDNLSKMRWLRLQIKRHEPIDADNATVEFIAHYKIAGRAYALHEISRFVREHGHWFYVSGQMVDS